MRAHDMCRWPGGVLGVRLLLLLMPMATGGGGMGGGGMGGGGPRNGWLPRCESSAATLRSWHRTAPVYEEVEHRSAESLPDDMRVGYVYTVRHIVTGLVVYAGSCLDCARRM
eukprot:COSAG06_NODE_41588_length_389_cov_4.603448_1_plen_111_part_10